MDTTKLKPIIRGLAPGGESTTIVWSRVGLVAVPSLQTNGTTKTQLIRRFDMSIGGAGWGRAFTGRIFGDDVE